MNKKNIQLINVIQNAHGDWVAMYPGRSVYFCGESAEIAIKLCANYFGITP